VIAPAPPCPDYIVCYLCFLLIKSGQLVDETMIKMKIQFRKNKTYVIGQNLV